MINKYYIEELKMLRDIAEEFAKDNPALAAMLKEPVSDPGVQRFLEGSAFLTAGLRQRLDDEIPEIIHNQLRQMAPQYLRPLPSCTMAAVRSGEKLSLPAGIPAGTPLGSVSVEGTVCRFETCADVDVHPVVITDVSYQEPPGDYPVIRVTFTVNGQPLVKFHPERMRIHLGGEYREASDLYRRLLTDLKEIRIKAEGQDSICRLYPFFLEPAGFSNREALFPWPQDTFDGFRVLLEYYIMPEKLLFIELTGWDQWWAPVPFQTFHVDFVIKSPLGPSLRPGTDHFRLSVVPAVNLFSQTSVPMDMDPESTDYPVAVLSDSPHHYQVYAVDRVRASLKGKDKELTFTPFHSLSIEQSACVYHEKMSANPVKDRMDFSVSLSFPRRTDRSEFLKLLFDIRCTNGYLPEALGVGEIRETTTESSESVRISNIRKPTVACLPPVGSETLWKIAGAMIPDHVMLTRTDYLTSLLKLFIPEGYRDIENVRKNKRRIDGIQSIQAVPADWLIKGVLYRGYQITIRLDENHFDGPGDLYLFGAVLDRVMERYASFQTYTRLTVIGSDSGITCSWDARLGSVPGLFI